MSASSVPGALTVTGGAPELAQPGPATSPPSVCAIAWKP